MNFRKNFTNLISVVEGLSQITCHLKFAIMQKCFANTWTVVFREHLQVTYNLRQIIACFLRCVNLHTFKNKKKNEYKNTTVYKKTFRS